MSGTKLITSEEKIILKDQKTFVEAEPPETRSRPLEWNRKLHYVSFDVKNFDIKYHHEQNEIEYDIDTDHTETLGRIVGSRESTIILETNVKMDDFKDCFYNPVLKEEPDLYVVSNSNIARNVRITLREGTPASEEFLVDKNYLPTFGVGSFRGVSDIFEENDETELLIEVLASKELLLEVVTALRSRSFKKASVCCIIQAFTYEVDDFFRDIEWPVRDFLIRRSYAALHGVVVTHQLPRHPYPSYTTHNVEQPVDENINEHEDTEHDCKDTNTNRGFLVKDIVIDATHLKGANLALWAIVLLLILLLFK